MFYRQDKPDDTRVAVRRYSDLRLAAFRAIERVLTSLGGRRFYRRQQLARGRFRLREERILVDDLPPELEGFTIAQLSDLHAGPFLGPGDLRHVVAAVNDAGADVVVLTGDLITHEWSEALLVLDDLAQLEPRWGTFAVFGNHDYKERREGRIAEAYEQRGIRFLRNASARVRVGPACVTFVGLEDLEEGRVVDLPAARSAVEPGDVEVVLCHNPMGAARIARAHCVAILSGHTHGTQVDLPWLRSLGPQHPGVRVEFGPTTLLVSRGLGAVGLPLRFRAPAEVVLVRLARAGRSDLPSRSAGQ